MEKLMINRIVKLIKEKGVNEKTFCDAIGVAQSTFVNWKKRGTEPKAIYIKPISEFLGVSERFLLTGEEDDSACDTKLQKEIEELDGVYLSLAKEAQKNEIDPRDIMMAINMIKDIRKNEKK